MAGRFAVLDLTALREFPSNIKPSSRKRKKENEKKEEIKEEIDRRQRRQKTKNRQSPFSTCASIAGLHPTIYSPCYTCSTTE